jgi:hypothetical protein
VYLLENAGVLTPEISDARPLLTGGGRILWQGEELSACPGDRGLPVSVRGNHEQLIHGYFEGEKPCVQHE